MPDQAKHTPGPWVVVHSNGAGDSHLGWVQTQGGTRIAFCGSCVECESDEDCANKSLIAASPELLHAVRELQWLAERQLRTAPFTAGETDRAATAFDLATEAVAKAEGR